MNNRDLKNQAVSLDGKIKSIQIISMALIAGVVFALVIFCALTDWQSVHQNFSLMAIIGIGYGMMSVSASFIVPSLFGKNELVKAHQAAPELQPEKLAVAFLTKHIIRLALLEGAAFLNAILFLLDKSMLTLGMAVFLIAIMAFYYPRKDSILRWIEENQG